MPDSTSGNSGRSRVELKKKLLETSQGAVQLAAVALEVAASAAQNVPYLGAIATVLKEVVKITDEVDICKATWKAVKSEVQTIQMLFATFNTKCTRTGMTQEELPETIQKAFKEFEICLLKVIGTMNDCKMKSKGLLGRIHLISKRSEITATANQCEKEVTSALRIFQATLQMDQWNLQITQGKILDDVRTAVMQLVPHAQVIATLNSNGLTVMLPPAPSILYGRAAELYDVVDLILNHRPDHVAIVGSGGIGKTSIALTAIHHPDVNKAFLQHRFFLSCEAIFTADILVLEILKLFGLSFESSGASSASNTLRLYVQSMTSKSLLCLDNFETPWDSDKDAVESLLTAIDVHHLTLIITSRDLDHPRGIKWGPLKPIQPLTLDAAIETWDAISHNHDNFSLLLIEAVECIPLAVTLLAQLAEVESSETLWASWSSESTRLVKSDGSLHRLNNLELSIELSLHGPRLRACSGALDFFTILCMLPQGLPESRIPDLETAFAKDFTGLRSVIRVLKQCSLAYALDGFLRVLSPIRQYMQSHANLSTGLSKALFTQMANHYLSLIPVDYSYIDSSVVRQTIQLEIGNISAVLELCLAEDMNHEQVLHCTIWFSRVSLYLAVADTRLLSKGAFVAHKCNRGLEGDCYLQQGIVYRYSNNLSNAENMLKAALDIHRTVTDRLGQAADMREFGKLYHRLDQLEDAERSLQSALDLDREVDDRLGQAHDLKELGKLYQRLGRLVDAETALQSALNLHRDLNNELGLANDLLELGVLYHELDRLEDAALALHSALNLHREIDDRLGQAHDLKELGKLYQRLDRLADAETALQSALDLYRQHNHRVGQANNLQEIGVLYHRLDRLDEADSALHSALDLHREVNDRLGQAYDLKALGELHLSLAQLGEAEKALQSAFNLHKEVNDRLGQANDLRALGDLYQRLNRFEDAGQSHHSALNIYTDIHNNLGQGNTLQKLGNLRTTQCRFSEAEDFLTRAMDAHERAHYPRGQQYTQELLKHLHEQQNEQAHVAQEDAREQQN